MPIKTGISALDQSRLVNISVFAKAANESAEHDPAHATDCHEECCKAIDAILATDSPLVEIIKAIDNAGSGKSPFGGSIREPACYAMWLYAMAVLDGNDKTMAVIETMYLGKPITQKSGQSSP